MNKFLIVGLGNIGAQYENTRHNIGFKVANTLASQLEGKFTSQRYADVADTKFKGRKVLIIKPTTFMNLSGHAVNYWMLQEKILIENIFVVVDELALPFGKIRIGPKGSNGGHNGLKHIQEVLQTNNYARLRFGIGNEFAKGKQVNYVLSNWNEEEIKTLDEKIKLSAEAAQTFIFQGLQACMNLYNK